MIRDSRSEIDCVYALAEYRRYRLWNRRSWRRGHGFHQSPQRHVNPYWWFGRRDLDRDGHLLQIQSTHRIWRFGRYRSRLNRVLPLQIFRHCAGAANHGAISGHWTFRCDAGSVGCRTLYEVPNDRALVFSNRHLGDATLYFADLHNGAVLRRFVTEHRSRNRAEFW